MSHQRYPSIDPKEPHSVSLKVLRLSRPSLVVQHPLPTPISLPASAQQEPPIPASLAYSTNGDTNPDPFLLAPILQLPPSFGSAYVGETFSCTLCANHDVPLPGELPAAAAAPAGPNLAPMMSPMNPPKRKFTRDVRIEAEMKTPGSSAALKLPLLGADGVVESNADTDDGKSHSHSHHHYHGGSKGIDLEPGDTLQRIVNFDLKEEGNHVLAVTVSYYEATETSGRTRTFRKLYQFICKGSLIVRTKVGALVPPPPLPSQSDDIREKKKKKGGDRRKWVMEAQLENCSEDVMQLSRVGLDLEPGLRYRDCNWEVAGSGGGKPVLHPGEVEQCCFVVEEEEEEEPGADGTKLVVDEDGRIVFGVLGIGWRSEMGNKGFLSTGKLSTRIVK
ncbi:hypothetical protein F5Y00DRAFT_42647 [Daldinia vernicosa]|uniref:uncharacterized protein n=1 Tax=Daldinia vernicosa TaxID=114800 RepID=UPI002008AF1C|nr:uncharacterized protein F5Y00DRAFT_42647 [Daldinia vernicosa]KAI0850168.1 hypothetical protein F5Y00DRAFT_42647 [Daldinia vernicosa]